MIELRLALSLFVFFLVTITNDVFAATQTRQDIINQSLAQYSQSTQKNYIQLAQLPASDTAEKQSDPSPEKAVAADTKDSITTTDDAYGKAATEAGYTAMEFDRNSQEPNSSDWFYDLFSLKNTRNHLIVGSEISSIVYKEPDFMKDKGYMGGVFCDYSHRFAENQPITSFGDIFSEGNRLNLFRVDGRFSWGYVDYESQNTGTMDDIRDYIFEMRGVFGYDILWAKNRLTPYLGFGYRYLNDDTGGRTSTTGHYGYERESNYAYMPIGFDFQSPLKDSWLWGFNFEFDVFLGGRQRSHLEDVDSNFGVINNEQKDGYGLRGSVKLAKNTDDFDFSVEPFVRYWNIGDSEISSVTYSGTLVGYGLEPENNSTEFGLKFGIHFK